MATTFTSKRAKTGFPASSLGMGGSLKIASGSINITANPTAGDIYEFCKVPAGAVVTGGYILGPDLDTNATETLDMDIGWKATADEITDTDGFGNLGVWTGDVTADLKPVVGIRYPLQGVLLTAGPKLFTAEAVIQAYCNVTAATGGTGIVTMVVEYFVDPNYTVG